ncbi:hypothetical protein MKW94_008668 [Papaver nudicaule]|uniref:Pre-rRNA-processing protein TSR2 n=1 Tax=Papaver nudicaule TaxID=74823 RepID=A0AA41SGP2_PAPNU|nr:hypothetical protein [Papaver nudicaule]
MASVNGGSAASNPSLPSPPPKQLSPQSLSAFYEGITLVLSKWTALQMSIQNEWGGRNTRQKAEQFSHDILSWFTKTKGTLYIDELEEDLAITMAETFNAVLDDGSEEEIAEELMSMHEECLEENYESILKLRVSKNATEAVSQSRQLVNEDDDESSDDEEASDMVVDEPQRPRSNSKTMNTSVGNQNQTAQAEDGWSVVPPRRNKGNRQN